MSRTHARLNTVLRFGKIIIFLDVNPDASLFGSTCITEINQNEETNNSANYDFHPWSIS